MTKFKKALIIYSASLAALLAAAIGVLALFLDTYEKNLPKKTANKYISEINDGGIVALVENSLGVDTFETAEDIISASEALSGEFKTARLVKESTQITPVYRIISSLGDVGKFSLVRSDKKALFGLTKWEIGEKTLYPEALGRAYDYSVCVPAGASVKANGKTVSGSLLAKKDSRYDGIAVTGSDAKCDIYRLSGLYTVPRFECDGETVYGIADGTADFFTATGKSVRVTLPSDAKLLVDGSEANIKKAEKGDILSSVSEFEKNIPEKLPRMLTYTVYLGQKTPDISVTSDGKSLAGTKSKDGDLVYLYGKETLYTFTAVLPSDAVLRINGVAVSDEYARGEGKFDGLSASSRYIKNMADGILYSVSGLLCRPEFSAEMNGSELHVCCSSESGRSIHAEFYGESKVPPVAEKDFAEDFARRYFKYAINGAEGIDENLEELLSVMKIGSEGYKRIKSTKSAFMFVNKAVYTINRLDVTDFIPLGDNAFTCGIEFDVKLRIFGVQKDYAGTLGITAASDGDSYLVCDIRTDSASPELSHDTQSERK